MARFGAAWWGEVGLGMDTLSIVSKNETIFGKVAAGFGPAGFGKARFGKARQRARVPSLITGQFF